jgi:predicted ester cyclase
MSRACRFGTPTAPGGTAGKRKGRDDAAGGSGPISVSVRLAILTFIPDGRYALKSFATDAERKSVCAYGVFSGTRTGAGGPCPPTGKRMQTD